MVVGCFYQLVWFDFEGGVEFFFEIVWYLFDGQYGVVVVFEIVDYDVVLQVVFFEGVDQEWVDYGEFVGQV